MSQMKTMAGIGLLGVLLVVGTVQTGAQVFAPAQGRVQNVEWNREGTTFTVTYDLTSADSTGIFKVVLMAAVDGAPFKPVTVTGDIGERVTPGRRKKIVWQVAKDTDNQDYDLFKFTVTAVSGVAVPVGETPDPSKASVAPPPPAPAPAPAKPPTSPDLKGTWRGTYANSAEAELVIDRQDGANFTGVLSVAMKAGQEKTEISVSGTLNGADFELREVSVIKLGKVSSWNLGVGSGRLMDDGSMTGTGKDRRTKYKWSFVR